MWDFDVCSVVDMNIMIDFFIFDVFDVDVVCFFYMEVIDFGDCF